MKLPAFLVLIVVIQCALPWSRARADKLVQSAALPQYKPQNYTLPTLPQHQAYTSPVFENQQYSPVPASSFQQQTGSEADYHVENNQWQPQRYTEYSESESHPPRGGESESRLPEYSAVDSYSSQAPTQYDASESGYHAQYRGSNSQQEPVDSFLAGLFPTSRSRHSNYYEHYPGDTSFLEGSYGNTQRQDALEDIAPSLLVIGAIVLAGIGLVAGAAYVATVFSGRGLDTDEWEVDHSVWMDQLQKDFEDSWAT